MAEESFVVGQQAIGLAQFYDTRVKTTPTAVTIKMVAVVETEVSSYDGLKCLFVIDVNIYKPSNNVIVCRESCDNVRMLGHKDVHLTNYLKGSLSLSL